MISYYINDTVKSLKDQRKKKEKEASKDGKDNPYPTYEELKAEGDEISPQVIITIKDSEGNIVRKISKKPSKGINRVKWDMRYASKEAISFSQPAFYNPFAGKSEGTLVPPGDYEVSISMMRGEESESIVESRWIKLKALGNTVLPAQDAKTKAAFQKEVAELGRSMEGASHLLREMNNKMKHIKKAIEMVEAPTESLMKDYYSLDKKLDELSVQMYGDRIKTRLDIDQPPTPQGRMGWIEYEQKYSTSEPTQTHRESFKIAKEEFMPLLEQLQNLAENDMEALEKKLEEADAPYTPGRAIKMMQGN